MARPFTTHHNALDRDLYLRIATELYLKRLIVGGLERVYELGKDFRNEGVSHKHNPEFTVVEWYEAYADYDGGRGAHRSDRARGRRGASATRASSTSRRRGRASGFVDAIEQAHGHRRDGAPDRRGAGRRDRARGPRRQDRRARWFEMADDLLSKYVEPSLQQADVRVRLPDGALAARPRAPLRAKPGSSSASRRSPAAWRSPTRFSELIDPDEQRARFAAQERSPRCDGDAETMPYDEAFVQALEQGMPPTAGVGLGIDRLVMLLTGRDSIREVVLFPAMRDVSGSRWSAGGPVGRLSYGGDGTWRLIFLGDCDEEMDGAPTHPGITVPADRTYTQIRSTERS